MAIESRVSVPADAWSASCPTYVHATAPITSVPAAGCAPGLERTRCPGHAGVATLESIVIGFVPLTPPVVSVNWARYQYDVLAATVASTQARGLVAPARLVQAARPPNVLPSVERRKLTVAAPSE